MLAVEVKSVAHYEVEKSPFAADRLIPLKVSSLILAGSGPEMRGLGKRNAHLLVADGRWMINEDAQISIDAQNRESEPK